MKIIDKYILIFIGVILLSACYENQEGCLDYLAVNYDVTADDGCIDCCIYPEFSLQLTQLVDTVSFNLGDIIQNIEGIDKDDGQQVKLLDLVYLISDVSLVIDGEQTVPMDTVSLDRGIDTIKVSNNFSRITRSKATYTIGEVSRYGTVSAIRFNLGIPKYFNDSRFLDGIENDLTIDPDSLISNDLKYTMQRLKIAKGINFSDTMIYDVPASLDTLQVLLEMERDTNFLAGQEKIITLSVDYKKWLQNIDFESDSPSAIAQKLKSNLGGAFALD